MMKKAMFQIPLMEEDSKKSQTGFVRCALCPNFCKIAPGKRGLCQTRENISGILYALNYGIISSEALDPVEKKPLNHFMPGSITYSLGSFGCNLKCNHCQNWEISQTADECLIAGNDMTIIGKRPSFYTELTPEDVVARAHLSGAHSISFTYNEPAVSYEFILETAMLAKAEGFDIILVTNGFISENALNALLPYVDAYRLDIKAFDNRTYEKIAGIKNDRIFETVIHSAVLAKTAGCHLELVTLLIPGINDDREKLEMGFSELVRLLGENTPLHLTAYHPDFKSTAPAATPELIYDAISLAKEAGFRFAYPGNIRLPPDSELSDTKCPECGATLIKRQGYRTEICGISEAERCFVCSECEKSVSRFIRMRMQNKNQEKIGN